MSEYLHFPFLSGASVLKGLALTSQDLIEQHNMKARTAVKKWDKRRQGGDGGEGSRPATKRREIIARKDGLNASEATSSPEPLQTVNPADPFGANHFVHNYSGAQHDNEKTETLRLRTSGYPSGRTMTNVNTEVGESSRGGALYVPDWSIHQRYCLDTPMWCHELMFHLAPLATQEESNALNNATALERAWFSLARGALAQTDILERFERLQDNFDRLAETHSECGETVGKLVQASELSQVNKDQALRIKELEGELAKKDSTLVYAERISAERAQEKEKLVTQLSRTKMEKFDCIRKLLPTVERSEEDLTELMSEIENFDAYADKKMYVEYDKMFEK
nr:hypothetical protein [Tanacetum cinerariifolium]